MPDLIRQKKPAGMQAFSRLMQKLITVPKKEMDAEIKRDKEEKRRRKK